MSVEELKEILTQVFACENKSDEEIDALVQPIIKASYEAGFDNNVVEYMSHLFEGRELESAGDHQRGSHHDIPHPQVVK